MTCLWRERFLRPGLPQGALDQLARHATECEECRASVARQEQTFALLREDVEPLNPFEARRLWNQLQRAQPVPKRWHVGWLVVPVAAAIAAVALFEPPPANEPAPITQRGEWLELAPGSTLDLGGDRVKAETTLVLALPKAPELTELWVARGTMQLVVTRAEPRTVVTQRGRIRVFAGALQLEVAGTEVALEVERGRVELEPYGAPARRARIGDREHLAPDLESDPEGEDSEHVEVAPREARAKRIDAEPLSTSRRRRMLDEEAVDRRDGAQSRAAADAEAPLLEDHAPEDLERRPIERGSHRPDSELARPDSMLSEAHLDRAGPERSPDLDRIEALMAAADRDRRAGHLDAAEENYALAARATGPFLEEALFRRAALLFELERSREAIALLARADTEIGAGRLGRERAALAARLWLDLGELDRSAAALAPHGSDRVVDLARLEVARAFLDRDPRRVAALLAPVRGGLADEAEHLVALARERSARE